MKYVYLLIISLFSLTLALTQQSYAQDCFDPSDPQYGTPACLTQRLDSLAEGTVVISGVTVGPYNCNDGIDNDGDGLTDCYEPTCNCTPPATETICDDGIDNDGNGFIDCQDSVCMSQNVYCESDCGNGVDDDGDGSYDYYDGDCANNPNNPNEYIIDEPNCKADPVSNVFDITESWSSDVGTAAARGLPAVGDIDNDGIAEVVSFNDHTRTMYVLDGLDGTIEYQKTYTNSPKTWSFTYPTIGDVDGDGTGEIFHMDKSGKIRAWNHDLTQFWATEYVTISVFSGKQGRNPGLADFNLDGVPELYYANEIRNAQTGELIIGGSHGQTIAGYTAHNWQTELNGTPVAVDILPSSECTNCDGLELVLGHIIYAVDIPGKKLVEVKNMNDEPTKTGYTGNYYPKDPSYYGGFGNQTFTSTAIVDFDTDGNLDVICSGATMNEGGPATIFLWNLATQEVKAFIASIPAADLKARDDLPGVNNLIGNFRDISTTPNKSNLTINSCDAASGEDCTWIRGVGSLNIASIDGDPELECTFMSGSSLFAIDNDWTAKWINNDDYWESSSGVTGTSVFDFDGDGASEIIYRDEVHLWLVDGLTGAPFNVYDNANFCSSQTHAEYPIVADVDSDGETELVVVCAQNQNEYGKGPTTGGGNNAFGFIRTYKAPLGTYWVPARKVWNQFSYFNVNINDDLSVPRIPQPHHINFAQLCNETQGASSFSLNKFLNQSPRISYCGNLVFPAAKLDFEGDSTRITPPDCPEQEFQIRLFFENNGDEEVERPIPISFYSDNPEQAYADTDPDPYFTTLYIDPPLGGLQPGEFIDTTLTVSGPRGDYTLYASLNDIGPYDSLGNKINNSAFYPLDEITGPIRECDKTPTVISIDVTPIPFTVLVSKIQDNRNCPGAIVSDNNGEAQVRAADGSALPVSEYNFTWTNIATGTVVSTSPIAIELDSGTYEIMTEYDNGVFTCQGIADTVRIERLEDWPDADTVTIEEIQPVSSCTPGTADGHLRALLNGNPPDLTNYSVYWTDEQEGDTLAIGGEASNLIPLLYKVVVNNLLTGCSETVTYDLTLDRPNVDSLIATPNTNCINPNGTITVEVDGNEADYDYMLIQMSPTQDTTFSTTPSFIELASGIYEVRAYNPSNDCGLYTKGEEVTILDSTSIDDITFEVIQEQTACEASYNGQLRANTGDPTKFDWVWYRGTITSGPSALIVGNDFTTPDTLSTNITNRYTVVATDTNTGCIFVGDTVLTETITTPSVTATNVDIISDQTHCNPNGEVQISVGPTQETVGYTFNLTQGSTVLATNATGNFTDLAAGSYSVDVIDNSTNCSAINTPIFTIDEDLQIIDPINIVTNAQTNCDPVNPDGSIAVNVGGQTTGYTFTWYEGNDQSTPVATQPSPSHTLSGVSADDYSVLIFSNTTGCDTLVNITLDNDSDNYKDGLTTTASALTLCDSPDGEITASLTPPAMGSISDIINYTFTWYRGTKQDVTNGAATVLTETGPIISNLDSGWYTVTAVHSNGCEALDTVETHVDDNRIYPETNLQITQVENSSCDFSNPNGRLVADIGGTTTGYTFNWYVNNGGTLQLIAGNTSVAQNLPENNYYLEVIDNTTGCTTDTLIELVDNLANPEDIELVLSATDISDCQPDNGQIEVIDVIVEGVSTNDPDAYLYDWYLLNPAGTDSTLYASGTGELLTGLSMGTYSVVATNDTTSCNSIAWRATVGRDPALNINFTFTETPQSSCAPPDGEIEIQFPGGENVTDFTYQWYLGADTTTLRLNGETSHIIDEVIAEEYTVAVTSIATGCTTLGTWTIPADANLLPVPDPVSTITPSSSCDPYNGSIAVQVDPALLGVGSYVGYTQADFFYYWFEGTTILYENANPDPFHPDNYDPIVEPTAGNNQSTITGLAPGEYTVIIVDVKDGINNYKCRSTSTHTYTVPAEAFKPQITGTPTVIDNTGCGAVENGSITVAVDKHASDVTTNNGFTFYWFNGSTAGSTASPDFLDDVLSAPYESTYSDLSGGDYTVLVVDNETGCDTTVTFVQELRDRAIPPAVTDFTSDPQLDCTAPSAGRIQVTELSNGYALADHHYYWYDDESDIDLSDLTLNAGKVGNTNTPADREYTDLEAGNYWVVVVNPITTCASIPREIPVGDNRRYPIASLVTLKHNEICGGGVTGDGSITIDATDSPMPPADFDISWSSPDVLSFASFTDPGVTQSTINNLLPGRYDFTIVNNTTGCDYSGSYIVEDRPVLPKLLANGYTPTHIAICQNEGEIVINNVEFDGSIVSIPNADFTFEWRYGTNDIAGATAFDDLVLNAGVVNGNHEVRNLLAGTYYVWVSHANGCTSERGLMIEIEDNSQAPLIKRNFSPDDTDVECDGENDGIVSVEAYEDGTVLPATGYTFEWFNMPSNTSIPSPGANVNNTLYTSTLSDMPAGDYKVRVTNNETFCVDSVSYTISEVTALPTLTVAATGNQTSCFSNGAAEVTAITRPRATTSLSLSTFEYHWYTDNALTQEINPATDYLGLDADGQAADSLVAGNYYVKAVDPLTGCESFPVQITIADSTETLIVILDDIADPIVACEPSDDAEGFIEVEVLNSTNIITRWYEGTTIIDPADSLIGFSNSLEIEDLVPGNYTIFVQDVSTGCSTTRTYPIEGFAVPLVLGVSSSPFTSCVNPNGQVAANVSGGSGEYVYRWTDSEGNTIAVPDNRNLVTELENGTYTVQVTDRNEPDCDAVDASVTIDDLRGNDMTVEVTNDFNMTNCDESNPNGQLTATVADNPSRYDFFWYQGDDVTVNPIAQGSTAAELSPDTYSVVVRDKVTGCLSEPFTGSVIAVDVDYRLPTPTTELLSAVTHCKNPNGSAIAVLDSSLVDSTAVYEYTWYNEDGEEVFRSTNTGVVTGLNQGEYSVSVVNLVTGCYSESASIEIPENIRIPDFEITSTPSTCFEATGTISIRFNEAVKVVDIVWLTPNGYADGFLLTDQPPGVYEATVTDDKGCTFTQTGEIESTIYAFNGISPNGDGSNDSFIISCIENFENNIVRIYNRAGAIVYENLNYDNHTSYFEGFGNRGLYIGGEKLPDGTYFYIIDKNNGDEPESGYLELIR